MFLEQFFLVPLVFFIQMSFSLVNCGVKNYFWNVLTFSADDVRGLGNSGRKFLAEQVFYLWSTAITATIFIGLCFYFYVNAGSVLHVFLCGVIQLIAGVAIVCRVKKVRDILKSGLQESKMSKSNMIKIAIIYTIILFTATLNLFWKFSMNDFSSMGRGAQSSVAFSILFAAYCGIALIIVLYKLLQSPSAQ